MPQAIIEKGVDGVFPIGLAYSSPDLASGETIANTTTVSAPAGLTVGAITIDSNEISAEVSGGVAGTNYKVQFWMITSTGKEFRHPVYDSIIVKVVE